MTSLINRLVKASCHASDNSTHGSSNDIIHMFWMGEELSWIHKMSMKSYLYHGHKVALYRYSSIHGVPDGVDVRSAEEIIPMEDYNMVEEFRQDVFRRGGRPDRAEVVCRTIFANLFRCELINKVGGWWSDSDMVCLKHYDFDSPYVFSGIQIGPKKVTNNAIFKCPSNELFLEVCIENIRRSLKKMQDPNQCGARLFSYVVSKMGLSEYVCPEEVFYPVNYTEMDKFFMPIEIPTNSYAIHLFTYALMRGYDPQVSLPSDVLLGKLREKYL